jgi:hypothetical protein
MKLPGCQGFTGSCPCEVLTRLARPPTVATSSVTFTVSSP